LEGKKWAFRGDYFGSQGLQNIIDLASDKNFVNTFDLNQPVKIPQLIAPDASANITTVPMKPKTANSPSERAPSFVARKE
jgi:hypothetical protein